MMKLAWMLVAGATATAGLCGCETTTGVAIPPATGMSMVSRQSLHDYAIGILELAASSDHPQLRANAIEGLHNAPELLEPYVRNGLVDENRAVRFVAAMTIGKFQMRELAALVEPLQFDDSQSVKAAATYALRRCGRKVDLNPLAAMLQSDDAEVRGNAALVLGELGDETAAPMIEAVIGRGMELAGPAKSRIVDLQLAEALVKLGKDSQVHSIRAALFLQPERDSEITALACLMLGRLGDQGSISGLQRLIVAEGVERRPAEVRMAAAAALGELGQPAPLGVIEEYMGHQRYELRYQAATALGATRTREALPLLQRLVDDRNPLVQVAAASAIARIERGLS